MPKIRRQNCKDCEVGLSDELYKRTHASGRCLGCYKIWYKKWCSKYYKKGSIRAKAFNFSRNRPGSGFTEQSLKFILSEQGDKCKTCGIDISNIKWEIDHILPISIGGTHDLSNLQILCKRCNRAKDNGSMEEFKLWIKHISSRIG